MSLLILKQIKCNQLYKTNANITLSDIYPSSFTNVYFEQSLSFWMLQNAGGGPKVLWSLQWVYGRALNDKWMTNITSGWQMNSLK